MSLSSSSIRRPVAVAMLFLAVAFLGAISLQRLPIDLLPDLAYPKLVIYTNYPNVPPPEIERFITGPIESRLARIRGLERIESISREGTSLVTLRFQWGTDMEFAILHVREALDGLRSGGLPDNSDRPIVLRTDPTAEPIMAVSVSGRSDLRDLKALAEAVIKRRFEQLEGVAQAAVTGGDEREIHVEIEPRLLESYGLTLAAVQSALDQANPSTGGGGTIRRGRYRYSLRTIGEFRTVQEIGDVAVRKSLPGQPGQRDPTAQFVQLREIATITDGHRDRESIARYNGSEAVGMLLFKESGANTVNVSKMVHEVIGQLHRDYPELRLDVPMDQASFIANALSNVKQQVVFGGILAFLILFLFLRDVRFPIAIALAIPISVLGAFGLMEATGVSLNIMSLGGLALGVGLLMDNSIVVIENIFRHRERGLLPAAAAAVGAEEVQAAVLTSTLTTIAVFGPIIYVEGVAGALFGALSLAVAFSLGVSVVVALTLLPTMAARWGTGELPPVPTRTRRIAHWLSGAISRPVARATSPALDAFDRAFERFRGRYEALLDSSLRHRGRVVAVALVLFAVTIVTGFALNRSVLPAVDQGGFRATLTLPRGTLLEHTSELTERLERLLLADDGVDAVFSRVGRQLAIVGMSEEETGLNTASLEVRLDEGVSTREVLERLEPALAAFPPNVLAIHTGQATALGRLLGGGETDLAVRVSGENLQDAFNYAQAIERRLTGVPSLTNVQMGTHAGQPEILAVIDRERVASYGLSLDAVTGAIQSYMAGVRTRQEFVDFDRKVPIVVRLPYEVRSSRESLQNLRVNGIPLGEMVSVEETTGASEIRRIAQKPIVAVHADIARGGLASAIADIREALRDVPPPAGITVRVAGENEEMRRSLLALGFAMLLAVLLVYMILAANFESLIHPFTILFSVPLGAFGAVLALWVTGAGLNTVSLIGIVVLVGIVNNDAVVKVDFINQMRRQGLGVRDAIRQAGHYRLRPIIITTLTTLLGVLPMALGIGPGAALQAPLAIAIFGGLATATLLTLIVIPVVYDLVEEAGQRVRAALGRPAIPDAMLPEPAPGD